MKKPALLLVLLASAASAQVRGDPAFARLPGPALKLRDSLVVDAKQWKLDPPFNLFVGPKGRLFISAPFHSKIAALDSTGRRLWLKSNRQDSELGDIVALGAVGDRLWAADYGQIAMLDEYGNVTKSLELPDFVRPSFANRKTFPVFEGLTVYAVYPDNSMLVVPRNPAELLGSTAYDKNMNYLLRVNEDGIIQRMVAKFAPARFVVNRPNNETQYIEDPTGRALFRVASDGKHSVIVSIDTTSAKVDSITVQAFNEGGEPIFKQGFTYPASQWSDVQVDSIARANWGPGGERREGTLKAMPRRVRSVVDVILDMDKTAWVTLRGNGKSRPSIAIDATGKWAGKLDLLPTQNIGAADRGRLWLSDVRGTVRTRLVRYALAK